MAGHGKHIAVFGAGRAPASAEITADATYAESTPSFDGPTIGRCAAGRAAARSAAARPAATSGLLGCAAWLSRSRYYGAATSWVSLGRHRLRSQFVRGASPSWNHPMTKSGLPSP